MKIIMKIVDTKKERSVGEDKQEMLCQIMLIPTHV